MYVEAARLFNLTYVKLHPLDISDIEILEDVFPFVNTDDVVHNLELEKNDYNIAASNNAECWARPVGFLAYYDHITIVLIPNVCFII